MVMEMFADHLGVKVIHVDASEVFLGQLAGVTDPEAKRKIIGARVRRSVPDRGREAEAGDGGHKGAKWLAQGHDLSGRDRVGGARARRHADDQEPPQRRRPARDAGLKLLEPLRELFKDEVRELGVRSACRPRWSIAIRSPARAWACASSAK
jgi:GMP synthase (glutamine-hydrolysing)